MKTLKLSCWLVLLASLTLAGCKKDEKKDDTNTNTGPNYNFSISSNGLMVTGNATYTTLVNGGNEVARLSFSSTGGDTTRMLQMDMIRPSVNNFTVQPSPQNPNEAAFTYVLMAHSKTITYQGVSGTINVTAYDTSGISGEFTINARDSASAVTLFTGTMNKVKRN